MCHEAMVFPKKGSAFLCRGRPRWNVSRTGSGRFHTITSGGGGMVSAGDTAWVLTCTGLVMLMTPGLAFFYGGMVRRKNILGILMQCFVVLCVLTLQWALFGYSLSFSPWSKFIGNLSWVGLQGVGAAPYPDYAPTIPHEAFM